MADRDSKGRYLVGHGQPGPGRKPIYDEAFNRIAYQLALAGKTDRQIAEAFDVSEATYYHWKTLYPAFVEALNRGRLIADGEAAEAAHTAVRGGIVRERRVYKDAQGNVEKVVEIEKEIPPDAANAMRWLERRQGGIWAPKAGEGGTDPSTPDAEAAKAEARNLADEKLQARILELQARMAHGMGEK